MCICTHKAVNGSGAETSILIKAPLVRAKVYDRSWGNDDGKFHDLIGILFNSVFLLLKDENIRSADGLHHRYVSRSGDVIHPLLRTGLGLRLLGCNKSRDFDQ